MITKNSLSGDILKGQIYYIKSDNNIPIGTEIWADRPAVIVSNNTINKHSGFVNIVYLTSAQKRTHSPSHIKININNKQSIVMCEQIHCVDQSRLIKYLGTISLKNIKEIDKAISLSLGFNCDEINYSGIFKKWEYYMNKYHIDIQQDQINMNKITENTIIQNLKAELDITKKDRDAYKSLYEVREKQLNAKSK